MVWRPWPLLARPGGSRRPTPAAARQRPPLPRPNSVVPFGTTAVGANAVTSANAPIVGHGRPPDGAGYWLAGSDGGVFAYGERRVLRLGRLAPPQRAGRRHGRHARRRGLLAGGVGRGHLQLRRRAASSARPARSASTRRWSGMAATPDGGGYWLVASDGGIFSYGDAVFFGSAGSLRLNAPVVGMAATPDGAGYWLVASDGGIFSYGDAVFAGSAGALHLDAPVTGMAATPDGGGYWLVARDGGVFTYGDAPYFGSLGGTTAARAPWWAWRPPAARGTGWRSGREPLAGEVVGIDPGHNGLNDSAPERHRPAGVQRHRRRAVRHDGHGDRQRLHRGAVQLRRRHLPGGRPAGGGRHGRADPPEQRRRRALRDHAGGHPQRRPRRRRRRHPRRRRARGRSRLHGARARRRTARTTASSRRPPPSPAVLRDAFAAGTAMPVSTYDGVDGLQPRDDLAGLNLTTVPKVLIECGNMRNADRRRPPRRPRRSSRPPRPPWRRPSRRSSPTGSPSGR